MYLLFFVEVKKSRRVKGKLGHVAQICVCHNVNKEKPKKAVAEEVAAKYPAKPKMNAIFDLAPPFATRAHRKNEKLLELFMNE